MTTKKFVLGSACAAALVGALSVVAAPGFAQTSSQDNGAYGSQVNPPQYSTPAEKQQTKQLNDQAAQGTTASPAVLNGEAPATNNAVQQMQNDPNAMQAPPQQNGQQNGPQSSNAPLTRYAQNDPQQQYQEQQQQYQQQQQEYQDKRQQYDEQQNRYEHNLREYDQTKWDYEYPRAYAYHYDDGPGLMRLSLVAEPAQQLANAPVESRSGNWVGRIRNVEIAPDGRPLRIEVSLNRRVSVWVEPGRLRFDPAEHVVFTDLTRDDLWDMPGATVESGGPY